MMSRSGPRFETGYNERLFSGRGLRNSYHLARFRWAAQKVRELGLSDLRLLEIGCFDGRLLDTIQPAVRQYVGLDANWEGGLDLARSKYRGRSDVLLIESDKPASLRQFSDGAFNAAAALETLEHLPPDMVPEYIAQISRVTRGYLLVSVPNEMGPVFLSKYLAKLFVYGDAQDYSLKEILAATVWRSDLVARNDHKGFDFRRLIEEIEKHFRITSIEGVPFRWLPPSYSPTVAIVAASV